MTICFIRMQGGRKCGEEMEGKGTRVVKKKGTDKER